MKKLFCPSELIARTALFPRTPVNWSLSSYGETSVLQLSQLLHFFPHRTCACCWLPLGTPEHSSVAFFLQWVVPWSLWSSLSSAVTETSVADLRSSPGFPQPGFSHWDISQLVACPGLTAFIEVKDALTQLWVQEKAPSQGWKVSEEMEKEEERVSFVV